MTSYHFRLLVDFLMTSVTNKHKRLNYKILSLKLSVNLLHEELRNGLNELKLSASPQVCRGSKFALTVSPMILSESGFHEIASSHASLGGVAIGAPIVSANG
jgi:hypothetical protein